MGFFDGKKDTAMEEAVNAANTQESMGENAEVDGNEPVKEEVPKRKPFALWEVGGKTYRLKLRTQEVIELENKYKTNLMNIMGSGQGGMPALSVMLDVAHAAMRNWQHGITKDEIMNIFSRYIEEGGSQLSFYMTVYMEIFTVSGFFSVNLSNQMAGALQEAKQEAM